MESGETPFGAELGWAGRSLSRPRGVVLVDEERDLGGAFCGRGFGGRGLRYASGRAGATAHHSLRPRRRNSFVSTPGTERAALGARPAAAEPGVLSPRPGDTAGTRPPRVGTAQMVRRNSPGCMQQIRSQTRLLTSTAAARPRKGPRKRLLRGRQGRGCPWKAEITPNEECAGPVVDGVTTLQAGYDW